MHRLKFKKKINKKKNMCDRYYILLYNTTFINVNTEMKSLAAI